jgi:heme-degrading monooxygenase HmoA
MIARIGYFEGMTDEQRRIQDENYRARFQPALAAQPGFIASLMLDGEDGRRVSVSVWKSAADLEEGARRANAEPLLAGHRGDDIPSPGRVEVYEVVESHGLGG